MDSLDTLTARLEAADGQTQRAPIFDSLLYLHKNELITDGPYDRAMELYNVGAFLEAGLAVMPRGLIWKVGANPNDPGYARVGGPRFHDASTPSLAFWIALLKVHQAQARQDTPGSSPGQAPVSPEEMAHG